MPIKFLKFILPDWITTFKPDSDPDNSSSDIYNFISSPGVHYYLSGDASSGMVITDVNIQSEEQSSLTAAN